MVAVILAVAAADTLVVAAAAHAEVSLVAVTLAVGVVFRAEAFQVAAVHRYRHVLLVHVQHLAQGAIRLLAGRHKLAVPITAV